MTSAHLKTSENVESLSVLPYAETPILEDEHLVLVSCPKYHNLRSALHRSLKSLILRDESHLHLLFTCEHSRRFGQYVKQIFFKSRFPKVKLTNLYEQSPLKCMHLFASFHSTLNVSCVSFILIYLFLPEIMFLRFS